MTRTEHQVATTTLEGHDAVLLRSPGTGLEATVVPSAGMVCASLRHHGEELLGQRAGLTAYVERGKTFGIPFLYPWANRLSGSGADSGGSRVRLQQGSPLVRREEHGLPIHGLLSGWPHWRPEPARADATGARVAAELDWAAHPELLAAYAFGHRLRLELALSADTLTITITVTATGTQAVPLAFGFHPYLRLPDLPRAAWELELPDRLVLALDEQGIPTGASHHRPATRSALGEQRFDDGLGGLADGARFALAGGGRRLEARFAHGYPAGQLFAPLDSDVVCFEPMAAETDALRSGRGLQLLAAGETTTASFAISVAALPSGESRR